MHSDRSVRLSVGRWSDKALPFAPVHVLGELSEEPVHLVTGYAAGPHVPVQLQEVYVMCARHGMPSAQPNTRITATITGMVTMTPSMNPASASSFPWRKTSFSVSLASTGMSSL